MRRIDAKIFRLFEATSEATTTATSKAIQRSNENNWIICSLHYQEGGVLRVGRKHPKTIRKFSGFFFFFYLPELDWGN